MKSSISFAARFFIGFTICIKIKQIRKLLESFFQCFDEVSLKFGDKNSKTLFNTVKLLNVLDSATSIISEKMMFYLSIPKFQNNV